MVFRFSTEPILFFVVALCIALLFPALFMDGMFLDGVLYSSVSKNYAEGFGSLWEMQFSLTEYSSFHEQPPGMFVLQGLFFKLFGDSLYTERIYCAVAAILNSLVLFRSWRILGGASETKWLPLLLWFVMPVTFWAFTNNVEECTMGLFVLLALNAVLKASNATDNENKWWILAGAWILAAGLTKGIQGMFLLSAPFWVWTILRQGSVKSFARRSLLVGLIPGLFIVGAWFTPAMHDSFLAYFQSRFGKTFNNLTATSTHHFHLLFELLLDVLPVLFIAAVMIVSSLKSGTLKGQGKSKFRMSIFLAVCAFCGILPLMITREQRGFYLVTALPILTLAIALLLEPEASRWTEKLKNRKTLSSVITILAGTILCVAVTSSIYLAGKPKRDADKLAGIYEIINTTGKHVVVRTENDLLCDWSFLCYAQRFGGLSFTNKPDYPASWLLIKKTTKIEDSGFTEVPINTPLYRLFRKDTTSKRAQ